MSYLERLKNALHVEQRVELAADINCDLQVLEIMIREDVENIVVETAANNRNCPQYLRDIASSRFSNIKFAQENSTVIDSICPIPWVSIGIQQNGDYRICCQAIYHPYSKLTDESGTLSVKNSTISEARNHQVYKNVRAEMLTGKKPNMCKLCYKEEELSLNSKRKFMLRKYDISQYAQQTTSDGSIDVAQFPLRYIDIRFGNLCNLKCRYCGPTDSSLWYEDFVEYANKQTVNFYGNKQYKLSKVNNKWTIDSLDFEWYEDEQFWTAIETLIPHIDRYYFTGGEPTINKTHFKLLQMIIDKGYSNKVTLEYNSNMVAIPEKLYQLWYKFFRVEIGCSIDGYREYANYLRYPSNWDELEKNLDRLGMDNKNIVGGISTTVNIYNVLNFLDLTKWLLGKNYKNMKKVPSYHVLEGPESMSIQALPLDTKLWVTEQYEKFYQEIELTYGSRWSSSLKLSYAGIINYMMAADRSNLLPILARDTATLDNIRQQSIDTVIPWLAQILNKAK
jgi:sulfatase maturation enzyme AslB (radical SAM superfamily)